MYKSEKKKCRGVDKSAPRYFFSGQAAHWLPKNCLDSELISLFLSVVCTDNVVASPIRNERYGNVLDSVHDVAFYLGAFPVK